MSVISVESVSKQFTITHEGTQKYLALRDVITNAAKDFLSGRAQSKIPTTEDFWALRDISFEISQGDRVGIIGRNGAGKSTLLKLLSRISEPTTGRIKIKGRVASLLEVGTGFHPELTGRENIFLNGAILGMTRQEIKSKFEEIVDFAEIERFLDTPVKRYSSGMYVRLAFAVAAHLEPEILIVDEVLAVGDAQFQKRCLGKMQDVSTSQGRTVIFVSHDMNAVSTLTTKAIFLQQGRLKSIGNTRAVIDEYLSHHAVSSGAYRNQSHIEKPTVRRASVITSEPQNIQRNGEDLIISLEIEMPFDMEGMAVSVQIVNEKGMPVLYAYKFDADSPIFRSKGMHKAICRVPRCGLYQGVYYLRIHLAESKGREKFEEIDKVCEFEVQMLGKIVEWGWPKDVCMYTADFDWEVTEP